MSVSVGLKSKLFLMIGIVTVAFVVESIFVARDLQKLSKLEKKQTVDMANLSD